MYTLFRFFLFQRPFKHVPTKGLQFLMLGNSLALAAATANHCRSGWPTGGVAWFTWGLAVGALSLLALVVQAAIREYVSRPDKPRRFWQLPTLLD